MTRLMDSNPQVMTDTPHWFQRLRTAARERFARSGYPTNRQEEWRFTNFAPISAATFVPAAPASISPEQLDPYSFREEGYAEIVFVNGRYVEELSDVSPVSRRVRISTLREALARDGQLLEGALGRHALTEKSPFVALNTGNLDDGVVIHLPRGAAIEWPIHLLFVTVPGAELSVTYPRVLIIAEQNTEAAIVESYLNIGDGGYFTNAVSEIVAGDGSRIEHLKLQHESAAAFHVGAAHIHLGGHCNFVSHVLHFGGALVRNDVSVVLDGSGSEATLNGLTLLDHKRHVDNHTFLDHAVPHCASHELYKTVLAGRATGVFKGKILVRPDAQKTDAKQTSRNLLLSDEASMNSQPALEIYADDVKCTHGSTTGPLDEQQIFYLRSRGIELDESRKLLTYAFAAEVTGRIKPTALRTRFEQWIAAQRGLPQDLRGAELK